MPRPARAARRCAGHPLGRRAFLGGLAAGALAATGLAGCATPARPDLAGRDPFSLGVASGEPAPDGFVLWTRLAPVPLWDDPAAPGGLTAGDIVVRYEIAADAGMGTIVRSGDAIAEAAYAHSVHLEVRGLEPGRPYWYRFTQRGRSEPHRSRVDRASGPASLSVSSASGSSPAPTTSTGTSRPTGTSPTSRRIS